MLHFKGLCWRLDPLRVNGLGLALACLPMLDPFMRERAVAGFDVPLHA